MNTQLVLVHDTYNCFDKNRNNVPLTCLRFEDYHEDVEFFERLYKHLEPHYEMFMDYEDEVEIFGLHELNDVNEHLKDFEG